MPSRKCKFTHDLEKEFPMFVKSQLDGEIACLTCNNSKINITNKGRYSILQHINSEKHQKNIRSASKSLPLSNTFQVIPSNENDLIAAVEATLAYHTVYHHFSYSSTDCTSRLVTKLFDYSKTATKVQCGKTKTQAIVDNVLAPYSLETVQEILNEVKFVGVSTDGSNFGNKKVFPVLIQYFEKEKGIQHKLIDVIDVKNEKSGTITDVILNGLIEFEIKNKCIALGADNTNTNFGGVNRNPGENIYTKLQEALGHTIAGIGCADHILNNSIHYAFELLGVDIDSIVFKIHQHFSVYTVRVQSLKEFCDEAEVNFRNLLSHSKTRFLSVFPGVERVLKLYEPLKEYFLSLPAPPVVLKSFFENPLNEAVLFFVHSLASIFHCNAAKMEKEEGSLLETMYIIESVKKTLSQRISGKFVPFAVRSIFARYDDNVIQSEHLKAELLEMYSNALQYLNSWTEQFEEFKVFTWMNLQKIPDFVDIQICLNYLHGKNVIVNEGKCFDQFFKLKEFLNEQIDKKYFKEKLAHDKWVIFFKQCASSEQYSEFLLICEYFFAIPAHNAIVERIFSLIGVQWTDERNRLLIESIKQIIILKYNFKDIDCFDFFTMIKEKSEILQKVKSKEKYLYERRNKNSNDL